MLDFCYMANLLLLLHCWALPRSRALGKVGACISTAPFRNQPQPCTRRQQISQSLDPSPNQIKITFAFNTGPLSWSILAFRNSLVLHSLDKVTSVYMHLAPALVSWWVSVGCRSGRFHD
jgi:hypothetical protein